MDAEITFKTIFKNVCFEQDLIDDEMSFCELVTFIIEEDGICSIIDDTTKIIDIKEIKDGR